MARREIVVSDIDDIEIASGKGAKLTIVFDDRTKKTRELDLTEEQALKLFPGKGREIGRRGRRPKEARIN